MQITNVSCRYACEKLKAPFGFKGSFLTELWQVITKVECDGISGIGVGVQSVLWSDAEIFRLLGEKDGNLLMYRITEQALKLLKGCCGENPMELSECIFSKLLDFARDISPTGEKLRETFVLNAMVSIDNALWQLYGRMLNTEDIKSLIPDEYLSALSNEHKILCNIPLVSYSTKKEETKALLDSGAAMLKIKTGFLNGGKMSKAEMCEWDKARLHEIHELAKNYRTEYTDSGNILYYIDANGSYDNKARLSEFLSYAKNIGALDRIALLEEPFCIDDETDVSDLEVRIAGDESIHSLSNAKERIALGYGAITLKPVAKTLSETLKILKYAHIHNIPCFCADLTANPMLLEFNKNIAARIDSIPGMKTGILESNGAQNYADWERLKSYHSMYKEDFAFCKNGLYTLSDEFYKTSGGLFKASDYYERW